MPIIETHLHASWAAVHEVEHHLAHLGSAFLVSPFDEAVAVSVDGFGDFTSAALRAQLGDRIIDRIAGEIYSAAECVLEMTFRFVGEDATNLNLEDYH